MSEAVDGQYREIAHSLAEVLQWVGELEAVCGQEVYGSYKGNNMVINPLNTFVRIRTQSPKRCTYIYDRK